MPRDPSRRRAIPLRARDSRRPRPRRPALRAPGRPAEQGRPGRPRPGFRRWDLARGLDRRPAGPAGGPGPEAAPRRHRPKAHEAGAPVVAALGGHVVKTGCAPYLIDWIDRGILGGLVLERVRGDPRPRAGDRRPDQRGRRPSPDGRDVRVRPRDFRALRPRLRPRGPSRASGWARRSARPRRSNAEGLGSIRASWWPPAARGSRSPSTSPIGTDIVHMTPSTRWRGAGQGVARRLSLAGQSRRPYGRRGLDEPGECGGACPRCSSRPWRWPGTSAGRSTA